MDILNKSSNNKGISEVGEFLIGWCSTGRP